MKVGDTVPAAAAVTALAVAAALSHGALGQPSQTAAPGAEEVLARVAATYAACRSYSDSGVVTDRYPGLVAHTTTKPFRTAFVRPGRFRFQFAETKGFVGGEYLYIVWRNGDDVRTWWDVRPGVQKAPSLGEALGAATGVSGGSAHRIPALLMPPEVGGRRLTGVAQARLLGDAAVGASACYRIGGTYADGPITVWVDKATFLVRRVDLTTTIPSGTVESTTTYEPILDGEVSEAMLAFDPPTRQ